MVIVPPSPQKRKYKKGDLNFIPQLEKYSWIVYYTCKQDDTREKTVVIKNTVLINNTLFILSLRDISVDNFEEKLDDFHTKAMIHNFLNSQIIEDHEKISSIKSNDNSLCIVSNKEYNLIRIF